MTPEPSTLCLGCWQNLNLPVVLRGPLCLPYRAFGLKPSRMNPNTCTLCEMAFSKVMKARAVTIDATVMFADLRGYTTDPEPRAGRARRAARCLLRRLRRRDLAL
jgi:adenylate cyclase